MDRDQLIRITEACELGQPIESVDAIDLARALRGWLGGLFPTLDGAFNCKRRRGERSNATTQRTATRDELVRQCAATCFPELCTSAQATAIEREVRRYQATAWRADRRRPGMPSDYAGTVREFSYRLSLNGGEMPKRRRLIAILSTPGPVQSNGGISLHWNHSSDSNSQPEPEAHARKVAQAR